MTMEYNKCKNCGACDGRAGTLWTNTTEGYESFCENCKDTFKTQNFVIHANLRRTDEEIEKTGQLLNKDTNNVSDERRDEMIAFIEKYKDCTEEELLDALVQSVEKNNPDIIALLTKSEQKRPVKPTS